MKTAFMVCGPALGAALRGAFEPYGVRVFAIGPERAAELQSAAVHAIETVEETGRIDWLFHCVSSTGGARLFLDIDEAEWDGAIAAHLRSLCASCKCVLPYLMGAESPGIFVMVDDDALELAPHEEMCRRGKAGAVARMSAEFAEYGVSVTELRAPADGEIDEWARNVAAYIVEGKRNGRG